MARIVYTNTKVCKGFKIINYYTDNTTEQNEFFEDDVISDFKFVNDDMINISGKISKVDLSVNTDSRKIDVASIAIDHSTKNNSKITVVRAENVLEYNASKEIKKVEVAASLKVIVKVKLSDGSESEMTIKDANQKFVNLTIINNGEEITDNFTLKEVKVYQLSGKETLEALGVTLLDGRNTEISIPLFNIKVCGKEAIKIDSTSTLDEAISLMTEAEAGGLVLPANTYDTALSPTGDIGISGNTVVNHSDDIGANETNLAGAITCAANSVVTLQNITLSSAANINVKGADKVVLRNCKITQVEGASTRGYFLTDAFNSNEEGTVVQIENCYFGNNVVSDTSKTYNLFEINSKLADGSYIKNCYFAKENCTHNIINIYDVVDGATIEISGNTFEKSANAIRFGAKGTPKCTINVKNNTYLETEEGDYAGILFVQPYGTQTEDMSGSTINIDNTVNKSGEPQLYYIYCGSKDTKLTAETAPIINVDGRRQGFKTL